MKAKFFFLGLCALALAACSIDEVSQVNDTNAISFKATATRATAATTNTIDGFTVWAWETIGDATTTFMDGVQAVRASEGSSTYTTAHTYYWPGAALDFYAFIPAATAFETDSTTGYDAYFGEKVDLTSDLIETANGASKDTYTGYVANATITDPTAISFDVHVPADATKEIDLGYAATLGQSAGTVGLNFRHALSQVAFKAQNGNTNWNVDIQGVTLCGIYKEGTYTLPVFTTGTTVHNATDAERGTWTFEETAVKGRFDAGIAATVLDGTSSASQSITATDGALMLIPQTVAEWDPLTDPTNTALGAYVRINCQVIENDTGEQLWPNYHELDDKSARLDYAEITVPFDVKWEEGKLYTYTIVFGEGLGYYAPDDPDTDLDGQPVLIPIRFTVDIDDFGNTDEVDEDTATDLSEITVTSVAELEGAVRMGYQTINVVVPDDTETSTLELTGYLEFNYDCTLNLGKGVTITGPDGTEACHVDTEEVDGMANIYYTTIIHVNGCNLTIDGEGTVATGGTNASDFTCAILVENGTVTINGGTYKGSSWNGNTNSNYVRSAVYCSDNGYAYINGGEFYAGTSTHPSAYAGTDGYAWVLNCKNSSYQAGIANIYCYGGTYYDGFDPANPHTDDTGSGGAAYSYVATGYGSIYDETTNSYTVVYTKVNSLTDLKSLIKAGASDITVAGSMALDGFLEFNSDCTLTIEDGVTITCPNATDEVYIDHSGTKGTYTAAIYVNGCNLTINGNGTVATDGTTAAFFTNAIWVVNGSVTVNGGTYLGGSWNTEETTADATTTKHAVYCGDDGYAYIYDGTFSAGISNHSGGGTEHRWVLNLHDASYKEGKAMIWCYGGKYLGFDPSNPKTDDAESYVAEGYTVTYDETTDYYTVVAEQ